MKWDEHSGVHREPFDDEAALERTLSEPRQEALAADDDDRRIHRYAARIVAAATTREKAGLWKQLAAELRDPERAIAAAVEAIAIDPRDGDPDALLHVLCGSDGARWERAIAALGPKYEAAEGPAQLWLAEHLVRLCRNGLGDPARAAPYVARIRKTDPSHPLVQARLASMYREAGAWDEQRAALDRALLRAGTDADRRNLHLALAESYEEYARCYAKAAEHYQAALHVDATCLAALQGLERIFRREERLPELMYVLDRQVDAAITNELRAQALVRLADLHEREFIKPHQAAPKLELALELDPTNTRAEEGLVRCYQAMRAWSDLTRTLERRAADPQAPRAIEALLRIAEIAETKLHDPAAAVRAYLRVYGLDPDHAGALTALSRLLEREGDWTGATAYRARLADLTDDARAKARHHAAIGELLDRPDRDPARARVHFDKALTFDPTLTRVWEAQQRAAERDGDAMFAAHCLARRAELTEPSRRKAQLLIDLARVRASLGDTRGAQQTLEEAAAVDPTNEAAASAVIDGLVRDKRWAEAQPVCDLLLNAASRDGDETRALAMLRLSARIATALGMQERALLAATAVHERAGDGASLRELVAACHALLGSASVTARAHELLGAAERHAGSLGADGLLQVAEVRIAAGAPSKAARALLLALRLEPQHTRALETLADLLVRRRDWRRACTCKERLAAITPDPDARHARLLELADLWERKAKRPREAMRALERAAAARPDHVPTLARLVALCARVKRWGALEQALGGLARAEAASAATEVRAKTLAHRADVLHQRLGDGARAVLLYEQALDLDPSRLDAFERVVEILGAARDYRALEGAILRMIARGGSAGGPEATLLRHSLQRQLGALYREKLGDAERALQAFREALEVMPSSEAARSEVLELLVVTDRLDEAVAESRAAVLAEPERHERHQALYELFLRQGRNDLALCAASVLAHLGHAGEEQRRFLREFPPKDPAEVPSSLAPAAWATHLLHPELDPAVGEVLLARATERLQSTSDPEPPRGERLESDPSASATSVVALVRDVAEILGVPCPELYARHGMTAPFAPVASVRPALYVSLPAATALARPVLAFTIARHVTQLRPELLAHALFPDAASLADLLDDQGHGGDGRPSIPRDALRRWAELADLSADRAGLLLVGDLDVAVRARATSPRAPSSLRAAEWRREMIAFAVSDEHAALRSAVGIATV